LIAGDVSLAMATSSVSGKGCAGFGAIPVVPCEFSKAHSGGGVDAVPGMADELSGIDWLQPANSPASNTPVKSRTNPMDIPRTAYR